MLSRIEGARACTPEDEERTRFFDEISEGLHAMAQPLTILRSSVAASAAPSVDATKQRRYLDLSIQQIERACSVLAFLQDRVITSQIQADCESIGLSELLALVVRDLGTAFHAAGVELRIVRPSEIPSVFGDLTRTRQALFIALKTAVSISSAGDVVELMISVRDDLAELIVRNDRAHGKHLDSSVRLSLSLAQANILSQKGTYGCSEDPFYIRMALPIHSLKFREQNT